MGDSSVRTAEAAAVDPLLERIAALLDRPWSFDLNERYEREADMVDALIGYKVTRIRGKREPDALYYSLVERVAEYRKRTRADERIPVTGG